MSQDGAALFWNLSLEVKVVTQIIGLGAVQLCCERQLARWKAFLAASPPITIVKKRNQPEPPQPLTRMDKIRQMAISLCFLSVGLVSVLGQTSLFGKDWVVPQILIDGMWGILMLWLWSSTFASALYGIFPRPRFLKKVRGKDDEANKWDFVIETPGSSTGFLNWSNPKVNRAAGFLCASALMASTYFGYRDLLPLVVGAQTISSLIGWYSPETKMKTLVQLQGGVMLLFLMVGGIVALLSSKSTTSQSPSTMKGQPSPWLLCIMTAFQLIMPYAIPGAFMIVNMRYEHTRLAPPALPHAPGEAVLIDHRDPVIAMPLHNAAIIALAACCALADALYYFGIHDDQAKDMILVMILGIPAVVGTCAVITWLRGDINDWWNYTEDYRPEIDMDEVTEVDEDGKAIILDEKRPATP